MEVSNVTSKGQVTIPARIRKALGLKAGSKVAFELDRDTIKVVPVLDDVTAAFGLLKSDKSVSMEEMDRVAERKTVERYRKTMR